MIDIKVDPAFSDSLSTACLNLGKLSGLTWTVESVTDAETEALQEVLSGVRIGVSSRLSPRFFLVAGENDSKIIVEKVTAVYGLPAMDGGLVIAEIANIIFSDVLNRMSVRSGEHLIVSTPQATRGTRGELIEALRAGRGGRIVRTRLLAQGAATARLDILAAFE